ncbi:MAG: enoyl-CoA hydratase [Isosphaeraceae bacterium]
MSQDDEPLRIERDGPTVRLTLNRPGKRNSLSAAMLEALEVALGRVADDRSARVVVLGASGPVFCAGHDLSEMAGRSEDEYRALFESCTRVMLGLRELPQPVIARVHGVATAAGCQLVAACDLAVASSEATFATPGMKIGLFCTTPMVPLVRAVPAKAAMEMLLTGAPITAARAYELGLVNRVVPPDALDSAVAELTAAVLKSSPDVLALGKRAFYQLHGLPEDEAYRRAVDVMTDNAMRPDAREGIDAFLKKRPPFWTGAWNSPTTGVPVPREPGTGV